MKTENFIMALNELSATAHYIDFDDFCERFDDLPIDTAYNILNEWLYEHDEFESVGGKDRFYWLGSGILINTEYLANIKKISPVQAVELWKCVRLCQTVYPGETSKCYIQKIHDVFLRLAEKNAKYYFWCAECSVAQELYPQAAEEYEIFSQSCGELEWKNFFNRNTLSSYFSMERVGAERIFGGTFHHLKIYVRYMLFHCYERMGQQILKKYSDSKDDTILVQAMEQYAKAEKCLNFIESNRKLVQKDTFFQREMPFLYYLVFAPMLETAYLMQDGQTLEKCFKKLTERHCFCKDRYYIYMAEFFVKSDDLDRAENCLKLGYVHKLNHIRQYVRRKDYKEEVFRRYCREIMSFISAMNIFCKKTKRKMDKKFYTKLGCQKTKLKFVDKQSDFLSFI